MEGSKIPPEEISKRKSFIESTKKNLIINPTSIVGPYYHVMNKVLADTYFVINEELKGIYHLTEAHAATLRQQTAAKYEIKEDIISNPSKSVNNKHVAHGLQKKYISFDSDLALEEERGLLSRLKEMPKEWTVVQLTRQVEPQETCSVRQNDVVQPTNLHITRLSCGPSVDETPPVSILVAAPTVTEGMPTIFHLMSDAIEKLRSKTGRVADIVKARQQSAQLIKDVVNELSMRYLKEWKCLLMGLLCSSSYSEQVEKCILNVINSDTHSKNSTNSRTRQLLICVASASVHLSLEEIKSAVCCLVYCPKLAADLVKAITALKDDLSVLMVARRHPVILILDEALDRLPWEMMPILIKHPVSRVPSIHILHALYHEHKEHIVKGCRIVDKLDLGFYIVNPDDDLKQMEENLTQFLEVRVPEWKGIKGTSPSDEQFRCGLIDNNVFLYCGHFNGTHFISQEDVSSLRVVALPLLFGCSSVALQPLGGRAQPSGVSDKYFMAGCACMVGMLWTVTSDDTDCMTVMLLNSWLPGEPIDLKHFRTKGDMLSVKNEPELLRLFRYSRETASLFSNAAALVARGIPVKIADQ